MKGILQPDKNTCQLTLSEETILRIGFVKSKMVVATPYGDFREVVIYEIRCLNSRFYYNQNESVYKWYYETTIGDVRNSVNLDITQLPVLYSILQAFRVKFNIIIE